MSNDFYGLTAASEPRQLDSSFVPHFRRQTLSQQMAASGLAVLSDAISLTRQANLTVAFQKGSLVEPRGIEPLTSCMPCKRSPS